MVSLHQSTVTWDAPCNTWDHQNNKTRACKVTFTRIKCTLWMESACFLRSSLLSPAAHDTTHSAPFPLLGARHADTARRNQAPACFAAY